MWTPERIATALQMRAEGISAEKIAKALGCVTRNAVLGKMNRIGAPPGAPPYVKGQSRVKIPKPPKIKIVAAPARPADPYKPQVFTAPADTRKTLMQLGPNDCRWPCGDPVDRSDFFFCGGAIAGGAYCLGHLAVGTRVSNAK